MSTKITPAAHTQRAKLVGITEQTFSDKTGLDRLLFFSDAVFAIAITLLALEIRLPAAASPLSNDELLAALGAMFPSYIAYGISFLAIGLYWMGHHRTFRAVVRYDGRLMMLNLLLLATVAFMPFPTSIISEYGNRVATQFYALAAGFVGLLMTLIWWYTHGNGRMLAQPVPPDEVRRGLVRALFTPVIFGLGFILAFWNVDLAQYSWLLIALSAFVH